MGISQRDYILMPDSYSAAPKTWFDIDFMRKRGAGREKRREREKESGAPEPVEINAHRYLHANTVDKVLQNLDTLHLFQLDIFLLFVVQCN